MCKLILQCFPQTTTCQVAEAEPLYMNNVCFSLNIAGLNMLCRMEHQSVSSNNASVIFLLPWLLDFMTLYTLINLVIIGLYNGSLHIEC